MKLLMTISTLFIFLTGAHSHDLIKSVETTNQDLSSQGSDEMESRLTHFLPDSNAYFSVSEEKFWFHGDTVIGEKLYKKVYLQGGPDADVDKTQYFAGVREDTLQGKIYCLHNASEQERLVADFGVEPGEQVSVYCFFPFWRVLRKKSDRKRG